MHWLWQLYNGYQEKQRCHIWKTNQIITYTKFYLLIVYETNIVSYIGSSTVGGRWIYSGILKCSAELIKKELVDKLIILIFRIKINKLPIDERCDSVCAGTIIFVWINFKQFSESLRKIQPIANKEKSLAFSCRHGPVPESKCKCNCNFVRRFVSFESICPSRNRRWNVSIYNNATQIGTGVYWSCKYQIKN